MSALHDSTLYLIRDSIVIFVPIDSMPTTTSTRGQISRSYRTEYRDRIVVRTDTVYSHRDVVVRSPPERYVPKFYQYCAAICSGLALYLIARIAWRIYHR